MKNIARIYTKDRKNALNFFRRLGRSPQSTVIRINLREAEISPPHLSLPCTGLAGLTALDELLATVP